MRRNVIILTNGLAGSSVLTGLVAQAGYWTGDTAKKTDYDTYENEELVRHNGNLLGQARFDGNYEMVYRYDFVKQVAEQSRDIDVSPYKAFLEKCDSHQPWIWKDPRLWLTIRFWRKLLDLERIQFIVLERELMQSWISCTIRRQIQTFDYLRSYIDGVIGSQVEFLRENGLPFLQLSYEDLIVRPERTIARINDFLGTTLTLEDMRRVYHGRLYRKQRSMLDLSKALLIYAKNYGERYR